MVHKVHFPVWIGKNETYNNLYFVMFSVPDWIYFTWLCVGGILKHQVTNCIPVSEALQQTWSNWGWLGRSRSPMLLPCCGRWKRWRYGRCWEQTEQQEQDLSQRPESQAAGLGESSLSPSVHPLGVTHTPGELTLGKLRFPQNSGEQLQLLSELFWKRIVGSILFSFSAPAMELDSSMSN